MDHARGMEIAYKIYRADGGKDVINCTALSGEPVIDLIKGFVEGTPAADINSYWDTTLDRYAYQHEYTDYWNATASKTSTGRPIDAWIAPVAPHAAVMPGRYIYLGQSVLREMSGNFECGLDVSPHAT
jgi:amidase